MVEQGSHYHLTVGEAVWAHTGSDVSFERGTVERMHEGRGTVGVRLKGGIIDVRETDVHKTNHPSQDGLPDNTYLRELNEATLLHNVRTRYNSKDDGGIYSCTGHILIAVNPFRSLSVYEDSNHKLYLSQPIGAQPPHIFAVADRMYRLLVSSAESQAIIVSGPSGAGKTETCKHVLRHLAFVSKDKAATGSKSSQELGRLLVQTNPLLEAFGNAETTLNKNSSRFGKFVQVIVSRQGAILGASIQTYLLETTRVVQHAANECTYHINYQLVLGCSPQERSQYQLESEPSRYAYLRSNNGSTTPRRGEDAKDFREIVGVLDMLRVKQELQSALFQVLSGLLALGTVQFRENANGDSAVHGLDDLKRASALLGTNIALVQQALSSRTMKVKGSEMQIPLKLEEARSSRDALAKAVYLKLFGWVVSQVNGSLLDPKVVPSEHNFLGILDIYGFENFEKNSLEQLFINFTNEQLHAHFANSLFKTEQEIYATEGIVWPGITYADNSECIEIIAGKAPTSIFNSLTEHSRLPNSSDSAMTEALLSVNRKSKAIAAPKLTSGTGRTKGNRLTQKEAFVIKHFAGDVTYRTEGWLSKNTDSLHEDLSLCMSSSTSVLLAQLFAQGSLVQAIGGGRSGGSRRAGFVADKYARQLEILMLTLRSTHSHFVRCIKPNHEQVPHRFVNELVLQQLLNSGMVDAVRLLSAGYPTRVSFEQLERQFKPLSPPKFQKLPPSIFSAALLKAFDLGHSDFLLGLTRAFFKSGKLAFVDSLAERAANGTLDQNFWSKMGKLLSLWRLRRGISAVRCLIYLESKMRRLRALWKFRRSANIANLVGRSWVRRANEIRYGRAIEVLQAYGRGFTARHLRARRSHALQMMQRMSRGYLARVYREQLRAQREAEKKARAKAERERKIKERREAMERKEQQSKEEQDRADRERRDKMRAAAQRAGSGAKVQLTLGDTDARPMAFKRTPIADGAVAGAMAASAGGESGYGDGDVSEDSDLAAEDSDEEQGGAPANAANLQDPRALLAATAALDMRPSRVSAGPGGSIPGLNLNRLSSGDDDEADELERSGSLSARTLSMKKPSMLMRRMGSMTPRSSRASGMFSSRGRALSDGRRLLASKTAKGSLIVASLLRVSKRAGESANQERFCLIIGDVLLVFMMAAQPEFPIPLRLWPAQLICLNQSMFLGFGGRQPEVGKENSLVVKARKEEQGAVGLQADDRATIARFGLAMSLGVASVLRARQQARLSLAQQLCHEKKLSLLKTQHMIDLLHKSQEMFFEAGSGQFDDCNAVCMHSGVMRQSLIDVTPFMPVSDFICEYCSCVIIPEEQCAAAAESCESKTEHHKQVIKKEQSRKLQLDEETLMLARDVRSMRERRKELNEELMTAWASQAEAMAKRQHNEALRDRLEWSVKLHAMSVDEVERTRQSLLAQIDAAKKARQHTAAQLAARLEKIARRDAANNAADSVDVDVPVPTRRTSSALGRRLSFSKKKKQEAAQAGSENAAGAGTAAANGGGAGGTLTRVLSFGRRGRQKASEEPAVQRPPPQHHPAESEPSAGSSGGTTPRRSVAGELVRKLSFGRKRSSQPA